LDESLPSIDDFDMLMIMGGAMSVNDEVRYSWLKPEKLLIKESIKVGKLVFGICLGSQLISTALGAEVNYNIHQEIGWYPIWITYQGNKAIECLPPTLVTFHWHGETFDLPAGAIPFAESDGCVNQGYSFGDNVIAMQFHMEFTEEMIESMLNCYESELNQELYVQKRDHIMSHVNNCNLNNELLADVLDAFAGT
jgi:GMP synthase (glutamine-hydrolysing)